MKFKPILFAAIFVLLTLMSGDNFGANEENESKRVRFNIVSVAEDKGARTILARSTIEGLPGTDFNIDLVTDNFKMKARFINDLINDQKLTVRSKLNTRRFFGRSPQNLPIYEEDSQNHKMEVGLAETLVLVPFGRSGGKKTLKIEITPELIRSVKQSKRITIDFDKGVASKEIFITAQKTPHRFLTELRLFRDGRLIAKGEELCFIEEAHEFSLKPLNGLNEYRTRLTISQYQRNRPRDLVGYVFTFFKDSQTMLGKSAGMSFLGDEHVYDFDGPGENDKSKYQLKVKVKTYDKEK